MLIKILLLTHCAWDILRFRVIFYKRIWGYQESEAVLNSFLETSL